MTRAGESSTADSAAAAALDDFFERLLRLDQHIEDILPAAAAHPGEPAVQLGAAFFYLFGQTPQTQARASDHLSLAAKHAGALNERERFWLKALTLWHAKAFDSAASAFEEITLQWPEDLPALRAAEFLYYVIGQHFSGSRFHAHTSRLAPQYAEDPDFLAMHAFACELSGDGLQGRNHAEKAIELRTVNPWAHHAMEHILLWEGNTAEAEHLMDGWLDQWPAVARTVHCHNAWHVALMHLDRLEESRAFEIFDTHVWGITPDLVVEQLDAIAFLWRAEMAGTHVPADRWKSIASHILPLTETLFMPFATAHYAYALGRCGDDDALGQLLEAVNRRSLAEDAEALRVWKPAGRSIVHAAAQLANDQPAHAAELLEPAMPAMTRIGGSDAQDDLFRFAYLDSLVRSGRSSDARNFLTRRLSQKTPSPLETALLARL